MIRLEDVWFRYDSGPGRSGSADEPDDPTAALRGVSLTVEPGEFVVLAGPNGSGKSTLVRQCNGLSEPDRGTVGVDGHDPTAEPVAVRATVGTVFQRPRDQLVAARVGDDVAFGPENLGLDRGEIDRRVRESLATVGMAGREDERVTQLSGGERARVALAGALAMEPAYLLLDEPFAGLDDPTRRAVIDDVRGLADDGVGVLLVTHDLRNLFAVTDRIVVLVEGSVAVDGPPDTVREDLAAFGVRAPESNGTETEAGRRVARRDEIDGEPRDDSPDGGRRDGSPGGGQR